MAALFIASAGYAILATGARPRWFAVGDKVVERFTSIGTQQGAFMEIPPTGKQVTFTGIDIMRIAGGKIVEHCQTKEK